jgi:hypothetical protein
MKVRIANSAMTLADSLDTVREVADRAALMALLREHFADMNPTDDNVTIKRYGRDERIGWDTHLICIGGKAALFSDGPPSS